MRTYPDTKDRLVVAQQRIDTQEKRIAELEAQVDALQDRVHLCTGYDRLRAALEECYRLAASSKEGFAEDLPGFLDSIEITASATLNPEATP